MVFIDRLIFLYTVLCFIAKYFRNNTNSYGQNIILKWRKIMELVKIENNQAVVSSRSIAEHFEKQHKDVLRSIKKSFSWR